MVVYVEVPALTVDDEPPALHLPRATAGATGSSRSSRASRARSRWTTTAWSGRTPTSSAGCPEDDPAELASGKPPVYSRAVRLTRRSARPVPRGRLPRPARALLGGRSRGPPGRAVPALRRGRRGQHPREGERRGADGDGPPPAQRAVRAALSPPAVRAPARQLLGTHQLYIQQAKVNAKVAFTGEAWQWHYDFATHHREDGVPEPLALNLHVFLDDVTEHNGPLIFIRGSHATARRAPRSTP